MNNLKSSNIGMYNDKNLTGIGGWLIFILVGLIFAPIRIFFEGFELFSTVFNQDVWSLLTSPESEIYSIYWAPIITIEIILNLLMMAFSLACLFAFLKKAYCF
jgi:membrane-anchored protein YejM (alkaline phosphatase superfamily)